MADFKSQGTFGLAHYRNSRAAQEMFEPAYLNLFTIQIQLPASLGISDEETNLLLENVQKISGLTSHRYPSTPLVQNYKWAQRRFVGAKPDVTTMDLSVEFEVNVNHTPSAYTVKTLRRWCDLAYDPLTGRQGLKADYTAPWMLITMYDRAARPFWQWKCYNVFPMSGLPEVPMDYQSTESYRITGFNLAVDYWDETIV
jgi:hypothetical protein